MIQPKKKLCKCGCGVEDYIFSKGLRKYCWQRLNGKKNINIELEQWFKDREQDIINSGQRCWECNEYIPVAYLRHATAHLFPKSIYKSVATNENNWVCLCVKNGCHNIFDSSIDNASEMKVWKIAVERYLLFKSEITEIHKYQSLFENKI